MRNNSGSVLSQYAIIIALIGAVLIVAFLAIGGTITSSFTNFYDLLRGNNTQTLQTGSNNTPMASLKITPVNTSSNLTTAPVSNTSSSMSSSFSITSGTASNKPVQLNSEPQLTCSGNVCSIDYGDFVLNGIPSNFKDYIEIQGTSGGEEKIAALMMELYNQLDETTEKPVKDALETLIGLIGSDLYPNMGGNGPCDQLSAIAETYECMAGGGCDHIAESSFVPGNFYHTRQRGFEFTLPPDPLSMSSFTNTVNQRLSVVGAETTIKTRLDTFKNSCINVGNSTGNDYSAHIAVIEALVNQAIDIKDAFHQTIKSTDGTNTIASPLDVNIASVTSNVASKSEEFTASLMCGAKGISCSK